jgi:hypothetical protein
MKDCSDFEKEIIIKALQFFIANKKLGSVYIVYIIDLIHRIDGSIN